MHNKLITSNEVKINENTTCTLQFNEDNEYYLYINDIKREKTESHLLSGLKSVKIDDLMDLPKDDFKLIGINHTLKLIVPSESVDDVRNELLKSLKSNYRDKTKNNETLEDITNKQTPFYQTYFDFGKYYQNNQFIYGNLKGEKKNSEGNKTTIIANLSFNKLEIIYDRLNPNTPFFNIEYYDGLQKKIIFKEKLTKKDLINELKNSCCFIDETQNIVEKVIGSFIFTLSSEDLVHVQYELMKEGYFLEFKENGTIKLLENTIISNLKYSKEDVAEALRLINEFLESRPAAIAQNSEIFTFMLSSPFHYCVKQLSLANNNTKGHLAYGEPQTSKTTTALIFYWLYGDPTEYSTSADSLSALENRLNSTTLPTIIDEAYNLLKEPKVAGLLKRGMYSSSLRSVTEKDNYSKNTDSNAYSTPFFTFNEALTIKDGLIRRFYCNYFDSTMKIDDTESNYFDTMYNPLSAKSKFKKLKALGVAFRDKIKPYLESNSSKLTNIRQLTIEILKEIATEVNVELNKEILTLHESNTGLHMNIGEELQKRLNLSFRKNIKPHYLNKTYCTNDLIDGAMNGVFDWLKYQPRNQEFIILVNDFIKHCRLLTNSTIDINQIIDYLELENYREALKNPITIKVGGRPYIDNCVRIDKEILTRNIFTIVLEDTDRIADSLDDY